MVDEAAYVDPALFFKVIVPILSMKNTALIALSSPEGEGNYFSALTTMTRSDGTPFFRVIDCFRICKRCMKLERVKAIECTHIKTTPHWLSSKKISELKTLYKANPEDALREFGGMSVSNHKPALLKDEVQRFFKAPPYLWQSPPRLIFTTYDPNGGGPSQAAMASGAFNAEHQLVVSHHIGFACFSYKIAHRGNNIGFRYRPSH